jgi:3-hydroxyisobutyrate dehydrogenase-like beta-hydroxyacid dehydrogenase
MSEQIVDVGTPVERATLVHTAATTFHAVLLEALGEMVALGEAWGMKRGPMRRWLLASPWLQELLHDPERARIATPAAPGRFSVLDALAAVELAIQMGQEHDLDLPCADVVYERLLLALEEGRGELDCSALSRFARPEARSDGFSTPGDAP